MSGDAWLRQRAALALLLVVLVGALALIFDREWREGEVFSPADLVFDFYPWAYDAPRATPTNPTRSDEAFYHQPLMATHFARLRNGQLPDLDPWHLSGVRSFFQGLDVGRMVSPFSLPFYALPAIDAVSIYGPLRLLVAGLCMWLLLRGLGLAAAPAALGGVAYALNGNFLTWLSAPMPTVAAWLPLGMLAVQRLAEAPTARWTAWLAIAVGLMAFGSYPATLLAALLALGAQALVTVAWQRQWRPLPWMLGGVCAGLGLGAAALAPALGNLLTSPASTRVVSADGAAWPNLATWALPDFWGSPLHGNWWHPDPSANYPEHVAYFGITVVALAGAGVVATWRRRSSIGAVALLLAVMSVTRAYGAPPGRWLVLLPGQAQSNPFRWYAVTACALAILAALGLHALTAWRHDTGQLPASEPPPADAGRTGRPWLLLAGSGVALAALGLVSAVALRLYLPDLRVRNLQAFELAQVWRFAGIAAATAGLILVAACARRRRVAEFAAIALVVVAAGDLAQANRRFNPTVPRDRFYPTTRGLDWLAGQAAGTRIAPVGAEAELVEGHLWGLYGIQSVAGFDFHGDAAYQAFLAAVQQPGQPPAESGPVWDFVGLSSTSLDLRLLGLLGTRFIVTSPVDTTPRGGGFAAAGELLPGRMVRFTFKPRFEGLRRVDVLTATYQRPNTGALVLRLIDEHGTALASRRVPAADLRDNDWLTLTFPPAFPSAGRPFTLEVAGEGTTAGAAPTVWTTAGPAGLDATLEIDGTRVDRALWVRAFTMAPERVPGATLAYAGDLNIYRNPRARPAAWFVDHVRTAPRDQHLSGMRTASFDPAVEAWLERAPAVPVGRPSRVTSVELDDDLRRYTVEAGQGGVLIVAERADTGWDVTIDGRAARWQTANAILMAVEVPAGARVVTFEFRHPLLRPALGLSCLALAGIVFALVVSGRRRR